MPCGRQKKGGGPKTAPPSLPSFRLCPAAALRGPFDGAGDFAVVVTRPARDFLRDPDRLAGVVEGMSCGEFDVQPTPPRSGAVRDIDRGEPCGLQASLDRLRLGLVCSLFPPASLCHLVLPITAVLLDVLSIGIDIYGVNTFDGQYRVLAESRQG